MPILLNSKAKTRIYFDTAIDWSPYKTLFIKCPFEKRLIKELTNLEEVPSMIQYLESYNRAFTISVIIIPPKLKH